MWPNPQETANLVPFPEEIFDGKPHFLCSRAGQKTFWEENYVSKEIFKSKYIFFSSNKT